MSCLLLLGHIIFYLLQLQVNRLCIVDVKPFDTATVLPVAVADDTLLAVALGQLFDYDILGETVLLTIFPVAFVDATIRPLILAISMLLVVTVLTLVLPIVTPDILAEAVHVAFLPLSLVRPTIFPVD